MSKLIGCSTVTGGLPNINNNRQYAIKVGSKLNEQECADKAKIMGIACTGNRDLQCPYYARPTEVGTDEPGDCYVMGYEKDEYIDDFNRTVLDNVNEQKCKITNEKLLSIYTTNPSWHAETQKRALQTEIDALNAQNKQITEKLDERKQYLASTYMGVPVEVLQQQDKIRDAQQAVNNTQNIHKRIMEDRDLYASLYNQKEQWEKEQQARIAKNQLKLKRLQADLQRKWQLVNNNYALYDWNLDVLTGMQWSSLIIVVLIAGLLMWYNYDEVTKVVANTVNTVQSGLNSALPDIKLGTGNNLTWSNLTEF